MAELEDYWKKTEIDSLNTEDWKRRRLEAEIAKESLWGPKESLTPPMDMPTPLGPEGVKPIDIPTIGPSAEEIENTKRIEMAKKFLNKYRAGRHREKTLQREE